MKFISRRSLFIGIILISILNICLARKSTSSNKILNYDYVEDIGNWSPEMANGYRDMAGLGYVTKTSINSQLEILRRIKGGEVPTDDMKKGLSQLINRIFNVLNQPRAKKIPPWEN